MAWDLTGLKTLKNIKALRDCLNYLKDNDAVVLSDAKIYADGLVVGLLDDRGGYDPAAGTALGYPITTSGNGGSGPGGAIKKGDIWFCSASGTINGETVQVGTSVRALADSPGNTPANWDIISTTLGFTPENSDNKSGDIVADQASTIKYPNVKAVYDWVTGLGYITSGALAGYATQSWVSSQGYLTSLANSINAVLTGYVAGAGTVSATDSILTALQKLDGNLAGKQNSLTLTTTGSSGAATLVGETLNIPQYSLGGAGTVTSVSVTSANGFGGSVANASTTPAITLSTAVNGIVKGDGTGISQAVAGTDYQAPISLTTTGSSGAATLTGATLNIPNYTLSGLGGISASSTDTLTNKAITLRVGSETSNATPSVNCQDYDVWKITALAANITSFTMTGTPTDGQPFELIITGTAARTIALGSQFVSTTITIPTTTVGTTKIRIFFQYDLELTKWACVGVA